MTITQQSSTFQFRWIWNFSETIVTYFTNPKNWSFIFIVARFVQFTRFWFLLQFSNMYRRFNSTSQVLYLLLGKRAHSNEKIIGSKERTSILSLNLMRNSWRLITMAVKFLIRRAKRIILAQNLWTHSKPWKWKSNNFRRRGAEMEKWMIEHTTKDFHKKTTFRKKIDMRRWQNVSNR